MIAFALILAAAGHPCVTDAERLCKDVEPGGGRVIACLNKHDAELSKECKENRKAFRDRKEHLIKICEEDAYQFCGGVHPVPNAIARCLAQHTPQLSPDCRKGVEDVRRKLDEARNRMHEMRTACAQDELRYCPQVHAGSGIASCLRKNQANLALECKKALNEFDSIKR